MAQGCATFPGTQSDARMRSTWRRCSRSCPGVKPDHVVEAFFSSLGVDADAMKIGVGGPIEQAEVGAAQHAEAVQGFPGIRISIAQPIRP